MLAHLGKHDAIHCFFPHLYSQDWKDVHLTQQEMRDWYKKGLRPAAIQVSLTSAGNYAPSYTLELWRSCKEKGEGTTVGDLIKANALGELIAHLSDLCYEKTLLFYFSLSHHMFILSFYLILSSHSHSNGSHQSQNLSRDQVT
jgi:hypothetical protein